MENEFTKPKDRDNWIESNFGKPYFESPAQQDPTKSYTLKDQAKVINTDNTGGSFPSDQYTGPEELSKPLNKY